MADKRNGRDTTVRVGLVLWVCLLCLVIAAAAIGFVWQKTEIGRLGKDIARRETNLRQLTADNARVAEQIDRLREPVTLDQRVRELNLGLVPAQPGQRVWLTELPPAPTGKVVREFAQRPANGRTP